MYPASDGRDIRLASYFVVGPFASQEDKYAYSNLVNDEVKLIRAYVRKNGGIGFDYYISVEGGISREAIVQATRRYYSCLEYAIKQDRNDVIGT